MTREEILSIEEYCAEHKVSHRKRLEELNIPFWHFYSKHPRCNNSRTFEGINCSRQCLVWITLCAIGHTTSR